MCHSASLSKQNAGIGSDNGLGPKKRHACICTNGGLVGQCIYASFYLNVNASLCQSIKETHFSQLKWKSVCGMCLDSNRYK